MQVELGMQVGDALLVRPVMGAASTRWRSSLIGYVPERSLLITHPEDGGGPVHLREGEGLAVRAFVGDRAVAFTSSVVRVCQQPFRYLHLGYPQRLEQIVVRKGKRVVVNRPATLAVAGASEPAAIELLDLSITGAMLGGAAGVARAGDAVTLETQLAYQGLADQAIRLAGTIKSVGETQGKNSAHAIHYGVVFSELEPVTALMLRAFVFEKLQAVALTHPDGEA